MINLKNIRKMKKITIKELSAMSSMSVGYLSDLENGKANNPSYSTIKKLAIALNVDMSELL